MDNKNNLEADRLAKRLSNAFHSAARPAAWSAGEAMLAAIWASQGNVLGAAIFGIASAFMLKRAISYFAEGLSDPVDEQDNNKNKPEPGPGANPSPS